jgi:hypothetical protein
LDTSLREANAEIQSGSYFGRFERPNDFDRVVSHDVVGFFKIVFQVAQEEISARETAPSRKVVQISAMVHPDKDWAFIADDGSLWLYQGSWSRIETELKPPCCSRAALCCATAIF